MPLMSIGFHTEHRSKMERRWLAFTLKTVRWRPFPFLLNLYIVELLKGAKFDFVTL